MFLLQSTQQHYPPEKYTHQSPAPYPEGSNGIAVVMPTPNADAKAVALATATSAAAKDRPKTKNIAGPPVYYPPGVELFAKKEESMAMQVSACAVIEIITYYKLIYLSSFHCCKGEKENFKRNDHLRDLKLEGRIILKQILYK
jgi:hypothetical protein